MIRLRSQVRVRARLDACTCAAGQTADGAAKAAERGYLSCTCTWTPWSVPSVLATVD